MLQLFRSLRALRSFTRLVRDPRELDDVFVISDSLGDPALAQPIIDAVKANPGATEAFEERARIGALDLDVLGALPEGTLGRVFADHMRDSGLDPAALPTLEAPDDFQYLRAHLYETHDIWHVVTGFETDVAGELGLQGFYFAQIPSPLSTVLLAAGMLNTAIQGFGEHDARMREIVRGWLMGRRAKPFFGVRWDTLWETPIGEVRAALDVDPRGAEAWLPPPAPHGTVDVRMVPSWV